MSNRQRQVGVAEWRKPELFDIWSAAEYTGLDESSVATIRNTIAHDMSKIGYPVLFHTVRSMPNYVLLEVEAENSNTTASELQKVIQDSELFEHGWIIGTREQRKKDKQIIDLFIRTGSHRPLTLPQVLSRPRFRKAVTRRAFIAGVNMRQQVLIRDFATLHNLMLVGEQGTTQNYIRGILTTLLLNNNPDELRLALIGDKSDQYQEIIEAPHILGRSFVSVMQGTRLLVGMSREIVKRNAIIERKGFTTIVEYNQAQSDQGLPILPHIILIIDSIFSNNWIKALDDWLPHLSTIVAQGASAGIHILLTAPDVTTPETLHPLYAAFSTKIMTRTYSENYLDHIDGFHLSLTRFVDAFIVESELWHAAEIASVTPLDAKAVVTYWNELAEKKTQDEIFKRGALATNLDEHPRLPPVPSPPSTNTITKATRILSSEDKNDNTATVTATVASQIVDVEEEQEPPKKLDKRATWQDEVLRAIQTPEEEIATDEHEDAETKKISPDLVRQAQALATYLGWLGKGPLLDVLGVSVEEADLIIDILKARQILERSNSSTPRTKPKR